MKKVFLHIMVSLLIILGASSAWAEKCHIVVKGECLWLIGKKYSVDWRDIARTHNITAPYTIYPGQKLIISKTQTQAQVAKAANNDGFSWKPGSNPWKGSIESGISGMNFSDSDNLALIEKVRQSRHFAIASVGQDGIVRDEFGIKYKMTRMGFDKSTFEDNPRPAWKDSSHREAGWIYRERDSYVFYPFKCKNPTRIGRLTPPKIITPTVEKPPVISPSTPPGISPHQVKMRDNWDWYVGGGNYNNAHQGRDNNGYYGWTKFRYRPLWFDPGKKTSIGVGAFGFLAGGKGEAARHYDYTWREAVLGITGKIMAKHKDFDLDLGAGRLWNDGKWNGKKVTRQTDDIFLGSTHANFYGRRDEGKKFLPKIELNIEYRHPFHTEVKKGEKFDNRFVEVMLTQWIYDFQNEDNSLNIAPGFNIGGGYEWGPDDHDFLKIGPVVEFSSYDNVVAGMSILNYKFQSGGQWHPIGGYISVNGAYRAWKVSRIKKAVAEELRSLPDTGESRLLHNPADYLK